MSVFLTSILDRKVSMAYIVVMDRATAHWPGGRRMLTEATARLFNNLLPEKAVAACSCDSRTWVSNASLVER
jgi:hypothetical protein